MGWSHVLVWIILILVLKSEVLEMVIMITWKLDFKALSWYSCWNVMLENVHVEEVHKAAMPKIILSLQDLLKV